MRRRGFRLLVELLEPVLIRDDDARELPPLERVRDPTRHRRTRPAPAQDVRDALDLSQQLVLVGRRRRGVRASPRPAAWPSA